MPLTLLMQNLVSNAIKYRDPQRTPEIRIEAHHTGAEYQISVQDNGMGIAAEYHERIFGLFKRLHTRQQIPGSGIGLALCRKIMERHNGRLMLESEPGKGSVFTFVLPDTDDPRLA
jgi:signal transduction histidine kinase